MESAASCTVPARDVSRDGEGPPSDESAVNLDFSTMLALQVMASLTSATILAASRGPAAPPGILDATVAMVTLASGFAMLLMQPELPLWVGVLGANTMFWLSGVYVLRALGAYVGRERPARWPLALVATGVIVLSAVLLAGGPWGIRALWSSTLVLLLAVGTCVEIARDDGLRREPARRIAFALVAVTALGQAARVVLTLPRWAEPVRPPMTSLGMLLSHVPAMLLAQGFGVSFLLMHHERLAAQATTAATTDVLTGCANRRALEAQALVELAYAERKGRACALVIADVDHFKKVNDLHGHAVGDALLVEVGRVLRASVRPGDLVARYGGEEFCVLLRDADTALATVAAERLCGALRTLPFEANGAVVPVRASFGVAASTGGGPEAWASLLRRADTALYAAKDQGRDRVVTDA